MKCTITNLRLIALVCMVVDHLGVLLGPGSFLYLPFRLIGRVSFPVFCFLIAQGYDHTHDKRAYLSRIIFCILLSFLPYYLLFGEHARAPVLFGYVFCVCFLIALESRRWFYCLICLVLLPACEYGYWTLVLILAFRLHPVSVPLGKKLPIWFTYGFYPVHLVLLVIVRQLFRCRF